MFQKHRRPVAVTESGYISLNIEGSRPFSLPLSHGIGLENSDTNECRINLVKINGLSIFPLTVVFGTKVNKLSICAESHSREDFFPCREL